MAYWIAYKSPQRNYLTPSLHWPFIYSHSYLLKGEEQPQCIPCNAPIDWVEIAPRRQSLFVCFFHVDSLTTLFDTVKFEAVFHFLEEIQDFITFRNTSV